MLNLSEGCTKQLRGDHEQCLRFGNDESWFRELQAIERQLRKLVELPGDRCLEDDFVSRRLSNGEHKWVIRSAGRLARIRHSISILKMAALREHEKVQITIYGQALLDHQASDELLLTELKIGYSKERAEELHATSNNLLCDLDTLFCSKAFIRKAKALTAELNQRRRSLDKWFYAVLECETKVVLVHMQLGYSPRCNDVDVALENRNIFLRERTKAAPFKHMLGYLCKLSFLPEKGLFHDLVLIYDGDQVFDIASRTKKLAQLWLTNVSENGAAFVEGPSLNSVFPILNDVVSLDEGEDCEKVDQLIEYFCRFDTYIHYKAPKKCRTIVKSKAPAKKKTVG
ncbi:hypothetical protein ACMXYR_05450 [Neptuniibacter sp. QD29_5]|uniref:hypothetical protein n=1 Tax=Neptuniibacter sp. QD29_5 TaxID=3398207 RepID=UPI0039F60990